MKTILPIIVILISSSLYAMQNEIDDKIDMEEILKNIAELNICEAPIDTREQVDTYLKDLRKRLENPGNILIKK